MKCRVRGEGRKGRGEKGLEREGKWAGVRRKKLREEGEAEERNRSRKGCRELVDDG